MKSRASTKRGTRQIISPEERTALIASQRLRVIQLVGPLRAQGKSLAYCAPLAGVSTATLCRIEQALSKYDLPGLEPRNRNSGRKSALKAWNVSERTIAAVRTLWLQRGCGAVAAWQHFARTPDCPPTLSSHLLKSVPPSLVAALKKGTT